MQNNSTQVKKGWAFYDWANSVYSLVITTSIFPLYFGAILPSKEKILFLGIEFSQKDVLYNYAIALSFTLVVIISPILSSIADQRGNKRFFLKTFCYLGSISCAALFFFTGRETLWVGILFSVLASVGFWGSLVFYNAYLAEIAPEEERDALSAKGFSLGYLGSSILLVVCLGLILLVDESLTRYSFLAVALWWAGFAQYTFKRLPSGSSARSKKVSSKKSNPYKQLLSIAGTARKHNAIRYFLLAFFCLSIGVQTIIYTATRFGDEELGLDTTGLIITVLIIQFIAIGGAHLFAFLSGKLGNIVALQMSLFIWTVVAFASFFMDAESPSVRLQFFLLGGFLGLVMGGVQSLARSTYSKLIPSTQRSNTTTFFSFFDVVEKLALILGTFLAGFLISLTGAMRMTVLVLALFFVLAMVLLFFVKLNSDKTAAYDPVQKKPK